MVLQLPDNERRRRILTYAKLQGTDAGGMKCLIRPPSEMLLGRRLVDVVHMTLVSCPPYVFGMMMGTFTRHLPSGRHHAPAHDLRRA